MDNQQRNEKNENDQPKKDKIILLNLFFQTVISWVMGVVIIIFGLASFFAGVLPGIIFLALGSFILPPISKRIESLLKWEKEKFIIVKVIVIVILVILYIIAISFSVPTKNLNTNISNTNKSAEKKEENQEQETEFLVTRVIDGDTIQLKNGDTIRILGIDAPEKNECYNQQATDKAKELLTNRQVKVESDETQDDKDRYGRLLRYIYYTDKDFGAEMIKSGMTQAYRDYPVTKLDEYINLEKSAKENKLGMWSEVCQPDTVEGAPAEETSPAPVTTPSPEPTITTELKPEPIAVAEPELEPTPVVQPTPAPVVEPEPTPVDAPSTSASYTCNCSKTCPQMSCEEAYYQLNTCGCSARDNDKDGVPCESICR